MKHKFSLILILALLSTTFAWAQTTSAYYEVPAGAFFAGMTENGSAADKTFYLPYNYDQKYIFTSTENGTWTSGNGSLPEKKEYSYSNRTMKDSCHTPLLAVEGKAGYQYGASGESYDENLYFHIGDSVMHYMTPARIYDETGNISQKAIDNYYTKTRDTIGVFFNNTDVMYIDSISIPISFGTSTGYSLDAMFPSDAKVYAKIYQATQATGKSGNKFDRNSTPRRTIELTQECFKKHPSTKYRGVLTATVGEQPLDITGPFVIELTNMKKAGCKFYIYAAKGRSGSNKWGYYVNGTTMTYPGDYTPAISVRAMFPALYTEQSLDVKIPAVGSSKAQTNRPSRKVYANWKYISKTNGWEAATATSGLGISVAFNESSNDWVKWLFTMSANETPNVREGHVTFKFRGKQLKFHLVQPPVIESVSISKSELSLKATETATLTASVSPDDRNTINWVSEDEAIATVDATGKVTAVGAGTTKIKAVSLDTDKYATCTVTVEPLLKETNVPKTKLTAPQLGGDVCFDEETATEQLKIALYGKKFKKLEWTLTKPDWVKTEQFAASETTKNILFKFSVATMTPEERNGEIKISAYGYEFTYTITQAGVGKLSTNHDYRTIVFGPQGSRSGLFLNDKGELPGTNYIAIQAEIPLQENIRYYSDLPKDDRFYNPNLSIKNEGTDDEYLQVLPVTLSNTEVKLEDNLYILIPNVDTVAIHLIQEPTPRVWQHAADRLTTLEVGNQGGLAHFKGYLTQKMTIVSNTPVTEDDIDIKFSNNEEKWVTPSTEIKQTATRDSVFITFNVAKLEGTEPRSTDITVSVLNNVFTVPLTQKTFGIEWYNEGYDEELVVPVAGGTAMWKDSYYSYLNVYCTEPYRDALLEVTAPEGVEITRQTDTLPTGRQRTTFEFSKKDTLTADWSGEITVSFDSTNTDEGFDYHFSKTFTITQAAPKVWLAVDQQPLVIAAEGGASNEFTIWSNMNISLSSWTVSQKPLWVDSVSSVSYRQSGSNYYRNLKASAAANTGTEKREGTITIKHNTLRNLFVEIDISQEPLPTYTREGSVGNYGTLCFPYAPTQDVTGADFYKVLWFNEAEMDLVLEQITGQPEAAVPYIFQYTDTKMVWAYDNTKDPEDISEDGVNGLYGVASEDGYTVSTDDAAVGTYLLSNNQIVKAAVESHAAQYRAYLKLSEVSTEAPVGPATAPRIHMAVPGNGAPTNLNGLNSNTKAHKILKDGQLLIIRDTKTYNAQGIELQ